MRGSQLRPQLQLRLRELPVDCQPAVFGLDHRGAHRLTGRQERDDMFAPERDQLPVKRQPFLRLGR